MRNTGLKISEPTHAASSRVSKSAGFSKFLSEHRDEIEACLRRDMGAGAKITKRAVNAQARCAWASLDEEERRVYSL